MKNRVPIPRRVVRQLLVEAGYRCSMPHCDVSDVLETHHIDGDTTNNALENLLVLCSNHHSQCTKRRIDKKACKQIKQTLKATQAKINIPSEEYRKLQKLIRKELMSFSMKSHTNLSLTKNGRLSILNRRYLFGCLKEPSKSIYDTYMSISLLGELKYQGSTKAIIDTLVNLKKYFGKRKKSKLLPFYKKSIISLARIDTKQSLNWLANEYETSKDVIIKFFIFWDLWNIAKNSKKYIGFEVLGHKDTDIGRETIFRLRNKIFKWVTKKI